MTEMTAEQVKQQYLEAMGNELGQLHYVCRNECIMLHWKWHEYEALFGSNPERVELLNSAASGFFYLVQTCMWEDLLLHIARMISSPKSAGKDNLTLRRLPRLVSSEIRSRVETLIDTAAEAARFACDWRNRRIAHRDLGLSLESSSVPLIPASRKSAREALEAIAAVLNCVDFHYCGGSVAYEFFEPLGGAEVLVRVLRDGIGAQKARRFPAPLKMDHQ